MYQLLNYKLSYIANAVFRKEKRWSYNEENFAILFHSCIGVE